MKQRGTRFGFIWDDPPPMKSGSLAKSIESRHMADFAAELTFLSTENGGR